MAEDDTNHSNNNNNNNSSGIVKKLLFPSFTETGVNEAFAADDCNESVCVSEASTQVHNNLSAKTSTRTTTAAAAVYPPPFFASTRPPIQRGLPESPPKIPRRPNVRSISNVAVVQQDDATPERVKSLLDEDEQQSFTTSNQIDAWQTAKEFGLVESNSETIEEDKQTTTDEEGSSEQWEEEATPAQTAFGKDLIFRREQGSTDVSSEVLSTASEMGTVINQGDERMQELDDIIEADTPTIESPSRHHDEYSQPVWEDESLSLPILMDNNATQHEEEKKSTENEEKISFEKKASHMLSMAFGRIGSGFGGNSSHRTSISAPNTPRTITSSPRRTDRMHLSPRHSQDSTPPSSFILRSPGSSAHLAASSGGKKNKSSQVLSPRLSRWQRERDVTNAIPENREYKGDDNIQSLVGPGRSTNPFQVARACFSFDDTSMDDQYEIKIPNNFGLSQRDKSEWLEQRKAGTQTLSQSLSWDVGGASYGSAFRTNPSYVRRGDRGYANQSSAISLPRRDTWNRDRIPSDFNPAMSKAVAVELESSKPIDMEREDALDILACLAQRGVTLDTDSAVKKNENTDSNEKAGELQDFSESVQSLQQFLKDSDIQQASLLKVLDELMKSHEYALEMKRASESALSWLKSIGRDKPSSIENIMELVSDKAQSEVSDPSYHLQAAGEDVSEGIDGEKAKVLLHDARTLLKEREIENEILNRELASCRMEIGRLRSSTQVNRFKSPNRSILDESDDASVGEDDEVQRDGRFGDMSPVPSEKESEFLDTSFLKDQTTPLVVEEMMEVSKYQRALDEANAQIRKLYEELNGSDVNTDAPIVTVESASRNNSESPGNKEERTVNVRMLDAENFVTEWDDLTPPLPPPPDHGLRSPIVTAVLEQWSNDTSLHETLLTWIEGVLDGNEASSVPPLTVSSLDHQVRDGFIMHVLPLLLRRADICVDVKMRALRKTTYDLYVSVDDVVGTLDLRRRHLETTSAKSDVGSSSVTYSSATTTLINNVGHPSSKGSPDDQIENRRLSYDEMTEGISTNPPPGLMSTLGGALGGLLARNRKTAAASPHGAASAVEALPMEGGDFMPLPDEEEDQPYHRVVSAPPGRIGVTFVEFRGHAMVSDVAADSPLRDWIFESDILVAIDELPVSGMRIREIIKILKDRANRQRALRVISSHAMNELALNTSALAATD